MRIFLFLILILLVTTRPAFSQISADGSGKYLMDERSGQPFFWLGDTAWELFHRMTWEDILYYLDKRKAQGFTVIQAVVLAELDGLRQPNRYGAVPFKDLETLEWAVTSGKDPAIDGEYDYWDHVDFVIQEAAKRGLYVGLLPTWGDKVAYNWGSGPRIFDQDKAYRYVEQLANRYREKWNIIWILGGDRPGYYHRDGAYHDDRPVWRMMAQAIHTVCGTETFITYHTGGAGESTSAWFADEPWLSMHTIQSGHGSRSYPVWAYIREVLQQHPERPVMDMEPCYEDHPINPWDGKWNREDRGYFSSSEIRTRIYRGVIAGGVGATYGHHAVWQALDTALNPAVFTGDTVINWRGALDAEVGQQIHHLKDLMLALPDWNRVEDSLFVVSQRGVDHTDLIIDTRNEERSYALIHLPRPNPADVDLGRLAKGKKAAQLFNPSMGTYLPAKVRDSNGVQRFTPPDSTQEDWVLVIGLRELKKKQSR